MVAICQRAKYLRSRRAQLNAYFERAKRNVCTGAAKALDDDGMPLKDEEGNLIRVDGTKVKLD